MLDLVVKIFVAVLYVKCNNTEAHSQPCAEELVLYHLSWCQVVGLKE